MIDVLKFDESFQAKLALLAYALTLVGMFALRGSWRAIQTPASS